MSPTACAADREKQWDYVQATIATITKCQQEAGVTEVSLLNFVMSDGINMIATRYVSHDTESPASLYYAEGSAFQRELQETGARPESATPGAASNAASARNTAVTGQLQHMLLSLLLFVAITTPVMASQQSMHLWYV